MKTNVSHQSTVNQTANNPKGSRPENKDNLDSRSGEEQDYKGNTQTHNEKEKHSSNKKQ
jgi:hypothetical protein